MFLASETRLYDFWFEFCSFETVEVKLRVQTWSFKQPSMALWSFDLKAKEIYFSKSFKLLTFFVENLIISSKQEKLDLKSFYFLKFHRNLFLKFHSFPNLFLFISESKSRHKLRRESFGIFYEFILISIAILIYWWNKTEKSFAVTITYKTQVVTRPSLVDKSNLRSTKP